MTIKMLGEVHMAENRIADPVPLGLAAFGVTLMMLSSANAGLWGGAGGAAVVGTSAFYGGIVLLIVGLLEFMRGNGFTGTVFMSFGAFWLSIWYFLSHAAVQAPGALGVFLLMFAIASLVMWICAIKLSPQLNVLFLLLFITLVALTYGFWGAGHANAVKYGGYAGMLTSLLALYMTAKSMINEAWGKTVLP
jgi:hypothetical protein